MKILVRGAGVLQPNDDMLSPLDILISDSMITAVGSGLCCSADTVIDGSGTMVLPGPVDMHVHLRTPGGEHKETIASGTRAAAAGGFTAVASMANTNPPLDSLDRLAAYRRQIQQDAMVEVVPIAAISKDLAGRELTDLAGFVRQGIRAFSDDGSCLVDRGIFREALAFSSETDSLIIQHAEDLDISDGDLGSRKWAEHFGVRYSSAAAEYRQVERDIEMVSRVGGNLHIAHVSAKESVQCIREAKRQGLAVSAEAAPHHFLLTADAAAKYGTNAKMKPPLRSTADKEAVLEGLADGTIDAIASDHAPHTAAEKRQGLAGAPFGIVGLETALVLAYSYLVAANILTNADLVRCCCTRPRELLRLRPRAIAAGMEADFAILDLQSQSVIAADKFLSRARNTPFDGWPICARVLFTFCKGEQVHSWER